MRGREPQVEFPVAGGVELWLEQPGRDEQIAALEHRPREHEVAADEQPVECGPFEDAETVAGRVRELLELLATRPFVPCRETFDVVADFRVGESDPDFGVRIEEREHLRGHARQPEIVRIEIRDVSTGGGPNSRIACGR